LDMSGLSTVLNTVVTTLNTIFTTLGLTGAETDINVLVWFQGQY